jgi:phospho-N-acetylmuramoyl-pentapeptide-transferase
MDPLLLSAFKVFLPTVVAFVVGLIAAPFLSDWLYANQMWKKKVKDKGLDGNATPIFASLHKDKEVGTPRMGGVLIWMSALLTIIFFAFVSTVFNDWDFASKLDFLSRNQTWLPIFTLVVGALIGLLDDYFEIKERTDYFAGGLSLKKRLFAVFLMSCVGAWWFYEKLDVSGIHIPFDGTWEMGIWFIPFFIAVTLATYSGGIIDGIDGLSGGVFASIFSAYGVIAFSQNQIDLAAFCFVLVGGLLAFLWFNIPPARFYMTETGSMGLTVTLSVIAFLTGEVALLPVIALPLVVTVLSNIIQVTSKKIRKKKVFLVAPIHHHFEAIGWPAYRVTMRYWIFSIVCAIFGLSLAILG